MSPATESLGSALRVAVVDMQPITPAVGGGRLRLLGLYHNLGSCIETTYVGTYDWPGEPYREKRLSDSLLEIDVPLSAEHFRLDADWRAHAGGATIIDTAFPILGRLSTQFLSKARTVVRDADIVVFAHPWVYPLLAGDVDRGRQLLVYDSQNAEALLKAELLGEAPFNTELAKSVAMTECFLVRAADLVLGCSAADIAFYRNCYRVAAERFVVVPNGVFVDAIRPPTASDRMLRKSELGLAGNVATFLGSDYGPNREAARFVVEALAPALPEVTFAICGGVGHGWFGRSDLPGNVRVSGRLDDARKLAWLHASDVALNPMFSGSGTNIKMFDYMAAGLPVLTTEIGARGITGQTRAGVLVCRANAMGPQLAQMLASDRVESGSRNREWVEAEYAWEKLSPGLGATLRARHALRASTEDAAAPVVASARQMPLPDFGQAIRRAEESPARVAILSTFGIRCGIAEYASYFAEGLLEEGTTVLMLANLVAEQEAAPSSFAPSLASVEVERVWLYDQEARTSGRVDTIKVLQLLRSRSITYLNVQYHRAFFSESLLLDLLAAAVATTTGVSVTLHNSNSASADLVDALGRLDVTVLVHNLSEETRLRAAGIRRTQFLPQGVRSPQGNAPTSPHVTDVQPIISTFGFLRPHKGLLELISALGILRRVFPGIRLHAQTALYPSRDSTDYLDQVMSRIAELRLDKHVAIDSAFVPIDEAVRRLAESDAIVLPYSISDEGSSAAAAAALAARRPMVVTGARIFDEIRHAVYTAGDNTPLVLAVAVASVVSNAPLHAYLQSLASRAASDRNWRTVARRFLQLTSGAAQQRPQAA